MSPALWLAAGAIRPLYGLKRCPARPKLFLEVSVGWRTPQCRQPTRCRDHARRSYASSSNASSSNADGSFSKRGCDGLLDEAAGILIKLSSRGKERTEDVQLVDSLIRAKERLKESRASALKPRITVFSVNAESSRSSPSQDLVSALLEDPLSDDAERRGRIRDRWKDRSDGGDPGSLEFEFGSTPETNGTRIRLPSPWLSQIPIVLTEQSTPPDYSEIFASDIPIIVLPPNPTLRKEVLWSLFPVFNPRFLIIINSTATEKTVLDVQDRLGSKVDGSSPRVLFIDATRALKAIDTLRSDPTSSKAIQGYQDDFNGSNFHSLLHTLRESVAEGLEELHNATSRALLLKMLQTSRDLLRTSQAEIHEVRCAISNLRESYLEGRGGAQRDVLGSNDADETLVTEAIERAGKDVKPALDSLKWWRLPITVDDTTQIVSSAAAQAYTKQFHDDLVFQSGCLLALQMSFIDETKNVIRSLPPAFHSPILQNALSQHSSHPSFAITPTTLLSPLQSRLFQLTFATNRLHRTAQRLLLTTFSASALSAVSGYGLWTGAYLDLATASASTALVGTLALRYGVGRWERAKRSWWQDWARVGQGLGRDLRSALESTLDKRVFVVPETACEGLDKLVETKREELAVLEEDISRLISQSTEVESDDTKSTFIA